MKNILCRAANRQWPFKPCHGTVAPFASLIHCTGIITGAGFETPQKHCAWVRKLCTSPVRGQYEQLCKAVTGNKKPDPYYI